MGLLRMLVPCPPCVVKARRERLTPLLFPVGWRLLARELFVVGNGRVVIVSLSPAMLDAFHVSASNGASGWCVGNSHALIVAFYGSASARCACDSTLSRLVTGEWVHSGSTGTVACPPYECACGQRHNVRQFTPGV